MTTGRRITLPRGFKLDKAGKLVPSTSHLPVNLRLQKQASRKIRPIRRKTPR